MKVEIFNHLLPCHQTMMFDMVFHPKISSANRVFCAKVVTSINCTLASHFCKLQNITRLEIPSHRYLKVNRQRLECHSQVVTSPPPLDLAHSCGSRNPLGWQFLSKKCYLSIQGAAYALRVGSQLDKVLL